MISLDMNVSGEQLGRALSKDDEELFYALKVIMEELSYKEVAEAIKDHTSGLGDLSDFHAFFRKIAEELDPEVRD